MKKKLILLLLLGLIPTISLCMEKKSKKVSKQKIYLNKTQCEEIFKKGLEYYEQEEYEMAFEKIKMAAYNDNLDAQFILATMIFEGKGCEKNLSKAMKYCSLAFNGGKKEAEILWFKIVTEFVKDSKTNNGKNPFQLVLDPSMLGGQGGDEEDNGGSTTVKKNKKQDESWRSMYN